MKFVIIEDEKPAARRLNRMLEQLGFTVEKMLHSVEEAIAWFEKNEHPDLIFLDIQLSDGLSFQIFEQVATSAAIIFTTAYDAYALQAFSLNSIDYLLKPIAVSDLEQAILKFKARIPQEKSVNTVLNELQKMLVSSNKTVYKTRFTTTVGQHLKIINTSEVECFYSENKGTYAWLQSGRNYLLDSKLENIAAAVNPQQFFRINRAYLIHISAIQDIVSYTNSRLQVFLKNYNEKPLIVARERVKAFKNWL